jgi:hypothetical protein
MYGRSVDLRSAEPKVQPSTASDRPSTKGSQVINKSAYSNN